MLPAAVTRVSLVDHADMDSAPEDRVYSDDDECTELDLRPGMPRGGGSDSGQTPLRASANWRSLAFRPTRTSRGRSAQLKPHRWLYNSITLDAELGSEAAAQQPHPQPLVGQQCVPTLSDAQRREPDLALPIGFSQGAVSYLPNAANAGASFLGRVPLPRQAATVPQVVEYQAVVQSSSTEAHGCLESMDAGVGIAQRPRPAESPQPAVPAPAEPPAVRAKIALLSSAVSRTDDGLNVVFLKRWQQAESSAGGDQGPSPRSVNTGWGNNFVRIDMKVRHGTSESHRWRPSANYRWPQLWHPVLSTHVAVLHAERARQHQVRGQPAQQQAGATGAGPLEDVAVTAGRRRRGFHGRMARVKSSLLQVRWHGPLGKRLPR